MNIGLKNKWSALRTFKWSGLIEFAQSGYRFRRNCFLLGKGDVQVASFPRSGNTWLTHLMADMFLQMNGVRTDIHIPIRIIVPDLYKDDVQKADPRVRIPFRVVKTHESYDRRTLRTIYLFRQAEDALCSFFHFHRRFRETWYQDGIPMGLDRFCLDHMDSWRENISSFIRGKEENADRIFFLSYESLHKRPVDALLAIMRYLGLKADPEMARHAVENHQFEKRQALERSLSKRSVPFYRKGKIGSAKEELQGDTLASIREKTKPLYDKAMSFEKI
jgi:Sulfotransferase domain